METTRRYFIALAVLAREMDLRGAILGPETLARLREALRLYFEKKRAGKRAIFFLAAGFAPEKLGYIDQERQMSWMMSCYLSQLGVDDCDIYLCKDAWGTFDELKSIVTGIRNFESAFNQRAETFVNVTSWYHQGRCARILKVVWPVASCQIEFANPPGRFLRSHVFDLPFIGLSWVGILRRDRPDHDPSKSPFQARNREGGVERSFKAV